MFRINETMRDCDLSPVPCPCVGIHAECAFGAAARAAIFAGVQPSRLILRGGHAMTVCHNSQSASWQSDSGLVMYFSTLPTPSSSVPCILKRQHLLKPTSNSALSPQNPCTTQINASPLQQHTYPASRKNSALRVSFFMDMTLQYYNQPHITVEEQIQFLRSEGYKVQVFACKISKC